LNFHILVLIKVIQSHLALRTFAFWHGVLVELVVAMVLLVVLVELDWGAMLLTAVLR
jgi:hypothetical protein